MGSKLRIRLGAPALGRALRRRAARRPTSTYTFPSESKPLEGEQLISHGCEATGF
jgi:hypothetical protein